LVYLSLFSHMLKEKPGIKKIEKERDA